MLYNKKRNMRIKFTTLSVLILITLFSLSSKLSAQISYGGSPKSFELESEVDFDMIVIPEINIVKAIEEDIKRDERGDLYRYGIGIPTYLTVENSGSWTELPNGDRIWKLKIKSENALALGVSYNNFILPEGGELYLYNEDKSQVIGSFTHLNNHPSGIFSNELIIGETVTLEYYSPASVKENPILDISEIAYAYRSVGFIANNFKGYNDSDGCEVDANCSEADDWRDQQRSAARISIKSNGTYGWCSGALVNNTEENCLPYFLTADHCADGASMEDLLAWVFYFNYERENCNITSEAEPVPSTITGAVKKARGGWSGSDFYLVLFTSYVPLEYDVHFSGWKTTNTGSTSGVSIHHPAGDIKKISTYTSTLSNYNNTHWSVLWSATANGHGVTEGGSSGSPIYNTGGQLIGTLTGGYSACVAGGAGAGTGPDKTDIYGKFSYSWASNGSSQNYRLKDWLDPISANNSIFAGKDQDCSDFPVKVDFYVESTIVMMGTYVHFTNLTLKDPAHSTSYLWEFEGVAQGATSMVNSPNRTYNTPGIFPVTLTATNNGNSDSKTIYITVQSNSITDIINPNIHIYPNPTKDNLNIKIDNNVNDNTIVNLLNLVGEVVRTGVIPSSGEVIFNVADLSQGIYFVRIFEEEEIYTTKVSIIK